MPVPRAADERIVLAVDVSNWLRPDAPTSDERLFCHVYGRGDRKSDQQVEYLPGDRAPKPVWLWCSADGAAPADVNRWWQCFQRRFDLEHTFRLMKQTLGWTAPKIRHAATADLWTWLIIAAHTQLRLARPLTEDLKHPWERRTEPRRLSPARVRRGFRNVRAAAAARPAAAPKPSRPGPGRSLGSKNKQRATRRNVGKTVKRAESIEEHQKTAD